MPIMPTTSPSGIGHVPVRQSDRKTAGTEEIDDPEPAKEDIGD